MWNIKYFRSYRRRPISRGSSAHLSRPVPGPRPTPGCAEERCVISISSAHTGEGRYPGDHPQTSAGPSLDPGLRRGERFLCGISNTSAHTGVGRYPGGHPQTSAGPSLVPGLRRDERLRCGFSIPSAHTGVGWYPGDHLQPLAGPSVVPGLRRDERWLCVLNRLQKFLHQHRQTPVHTAPGPCLPWRPRSAGRHGA